MSTPTLIIADNLTPEDEAMVQALYSRSAESAAVHLAKVAESGSGKFMANYYVGYGHKSIADCGTTTMFIENVSTLAAKAIQDWPLYSGQETSTRYIDMSKQPIEDPVDSPESRAILARWMSFYGESEDRITGLLMRRYPITAADKPDVYARAIKARGFDVMRGFLPAGICTQLSWHSNLRQAADHLVGLAYHPTNEISGVARRLQGRLAECYPSSGFDRDIALVAGVGANDSATERRAWEQKVAKEFTYSLAHTPLGDDRTYMRFKGQSLRRAVLDDPFELERGTYSDMLATRPRGCVLPHFLSDLGQFTTEFTLDFGSFRDIQRHRNGVCRMPILATNWGFEPWYLEQLGDPDNGNIGGLRDVATKLIHEQIQAINKLDVDRFHRQYYVALGFRVPVRVTYGLPALLYILELRSTKFIHPTLRKRIRQMAAEFKMWFPQIAVHDNVDPDDWDVRRGTQTITEKNT